LEDNPLTTQGKSTGNRFSNTGEELPPEYQILEQKFKVFDYTKSLSSRLVKRRVGNAHSLLSPRKSAYIPPEETESFGRDAMEEKGDEAIKEAFEGKEYDDSICALNDGEPEKRDFGK
jgi:hypothetical protein